MEATHMKTDIIANSNPLQISFVLDLILQLQPDSVLDIGCGGGKYGLLIRENQRSAFDHERKNTLGWNCLCQKPQ